MRLLLDASVLYWLLEGNPRLGARARRQIEAAEPVVSEITLFEIAIKSSIGKTATGLLDAVRELRFERLGITDAHLDRFQSLPVHHRDPFDRALIAQAMVEGLTVVTSHRAFRAYDVRVIDARE